MKKGDKIRFTGSESDYSQTTEGKAYEIIEVTERKARYLGDNGCVYAWYYISYPNDFTLVQVQNTAIPTAAPVERDLNMLQEGDIIKFMGGTGEERDRYRDTTVGKEYRIYRVVLDSDGNVQRVRYLDDNNDAVSWRPNIYGEMYHFKVMTEQRLYKDDVLATAPTLQDLKTTLDMALLLNDIQWAQETYEQIQQMEGEHA